MSYSFLLRTIFTCLFFTALWTSAVAQPYPSEQNRFAVSQVRGCAPFNVAVVNQNIPPGNTGPVIYKFDYEGNINDPITFDADQDEQDTIYAIPGTYKVLQILEGGQFDSVTIEVLEPRVPQVLVSPCINNGVFVSIDDDYYDALEINLGDGSPLVTTSTDEPSAVYSYTAAGQYNISVKGIFNNADVQNCTVYDTTITTINTLTVADLQSITVQSATAVQIDYQLPNPDVSYRLEVAEAGTDDFTFAQFDIDGNSFTIDDPQFQFSEQVYCFRIVAVNRCDESQNLVSDALCSIALQGEAQDLQNQLNWISDGFTEYALTRDGSALLTSSATDYLDTDVVCQQTYQYQVQATSEVGTSTALVSLTTFTNTISPAPDSIGVVPTGQQLRFEWRAVDDVTTYYIYRGVDSEVPVRYDSVTATADGIAPRFYEDNQVESGTTYCYQLTYVDACGNESGQSATVCAEVPRRGRLIFPNAFTPDGDGLNDVFVYRAQLVSTVTMRIFNRWGELLFQTDELEEGWDGFYRGARAPQGTYLYQVEVEDQLGNRFTQEGRLTLLTN